MNSLQSAIKLIENRLNSRCCGAFANEDTTCITKEEAERLLSLLKTHEAEEDTLQFDLKMSDKAF